MTTLLKRKKVPIVAAGPAGPLERVQATPKMTLGSAATTVAVIFPAPPTVGNSIIIGIISGTVTSAITGVTDNKGNTYTLAKEQPQAGLASTVSIYFSSAITLTGDTFTVTATGGGNALRTAVAMEVGGTVVVDQTTGLTTSGASVTSGTTAALTGNSDFLVAVIGTSSATITVNVPTPPWTQEAEEVASATRGEIDSRLITTSAGTTQSATWTLAGGHNAATALVAFKS